MAVQAAPRAGLPINSHGPSSCLIHGDHLHLKTQVLSFPRTPEFNPLYVNSLSSHKYRVRAQAASRSDFNESASRLTEEARKKAAETAKSVSDAVKSMADAARERVEGFQNERELKRRFRRAKEAANERLGDLAFETRRTLQRWNRQYRVSERIDEAADLFRQELKRIDREFGVGQKSRALSMDFRRNWPRYKRELNDFFNTPLGRSAATLVFLWFALSGWLFRIIILGTWVLPFAAPFLIGAVARNAVIEGACPACKRRFIGNRSQVIQCMNCRAVVWQPRDDFSKGSSEPEIIDVEIEDK